MTDYDEFDGPLMPASKSNRPVVLRMTVFPRL